MYNFYLWLFCRKREGFIEKKKAPSPGQPPFFFYNCITFLYYLIICHTIQNWFLLLFSTSKPVEISCSLYIYNRNLYLFSIFHILIDIFKILHSNTTANLTLMMSDLAEYQVKYLNYHFCNELHQ